MKEDKIELLNCPFCGSEADIDSSPTQEVIRCRICPASMVHDGSSKALRYMWNSRVNREK